MREMGSRPRLSAGKKWLFAAAAVLLAFFLLEMVLALIGVEPDRERPDPLSTFVAGASHFVVETDDAGIEFVRTASDRRKFLNDQAFPRKKPADATRVFCVGGSTTYGRPFYDDASFAAYLRAFLPVADPSRRWEVINAGGISYASYRVLGVMRELAAFEPDVFVVYTGQNEFLERRTYGALLETPGAVRTAMAWAAGTRTGTLIRRMLPKGDSDSDAVLPTDPKGIAVDSVGPDAYRRDDVFRDQVVRHFRINLLKMVEIAENAGARIVFVKPESNLVDFSPFRSDATPGLSEEKQREFRRLLMQGTELLTVGRAGEAVAVLREAVAIDGRHAGAHFRLGRALLATEGIAAAKGEFIRARDEDICPMRAITPIGDTVVDVARMTGSGLVDLPAWITADEESFYDHVHLTQASTRILAERLVGEVSGVAWETAMADRVDANRLAFDRSVHARELRKLARMLVWLKEPGLALRAARESLELDPDSPESEAVLASLLLPKDPAAAEKHVRRALTLDAKSPVAHYQMALVLEGRQDLKGAVGHLLTATELAPKYKEAWERLALLRIRMGRINDAVQAFERVVALAPDVSAARSNLGLAYAKQGEPEKALREYDEALRLDPRHASAHLNRGILLQEQGRTDDAKESFRAVLALRPGHPDAQRRLRELSGQ